MRCNRWGLRRLSATGPVNRSSITVWEMEQRNRESSWKLVPRLLVPNCLSCLSFRITSGPFQPRQLRRRFTRWPRTRRPIFAGFRLSTPTVLMSRSPTKFSRERSLACAMTANRPSSCWNWNDFPVTPMLTIIEFTVNRATWNRLGRPRIPSQFYNNGC